MRHLRRVSISKASTKDVDEPEEILFFQIFFAVFSLITSAAFGKQ